MNTQIKQEYKKNRIPRVGRYQGTGSPYFHMVTARQAYLSAQRAIRVREGWREFKGVVKLEAVPDHGYWDLDDLAGDAFNPEFNPDINPDILKRQEKEFITRVNREGVYTLISYVKCPCCGSWEQVGSVGGFVGDDWDGSGYDQDLKLAAIERAKELYNTGVM